MTCTAPPILSRTCLECVKRFLGPTRAEIRHGLPRPGVTLAYNGVNACGLHAANDELEATVKKALYRQLRRAQVLISNRFMATRLLVGCDGQAAGVIAVNTRTAECPVLRAKAVILCMGAAGRLGLPHSGYLWGTYENAANSGDGYALAFHAGAGLANLECFQINPLIKDYNGPACAYVAGPFGAYTANSAGDRFIECDYWSGQMM